MTTPYEGALKEENSRLHNIIAGLTDKVRLDFAGMALQGLLANPTWTVAALAVYGVGEGQAFEAGAGIAFRYADAMIQELVEKAGGQ